MFLGAVGLNDAFSQNAVEGDQSNVFSVPALKSQLYLIEQANDNGSPDGNLILLNGDKNGVLPTPSSLPPPSNDNCSDGLGPAYTLFPGAACLSGTLKNGNGNNTDATIEPGETTGCMTGPPTKTVWYNFTATSTDMWISTEQTGSFVCGLNFGIRVYPYSGVCPPPSGAAIDCKDYTGYSAGQIYNILNLTGLTIGQTYMVQIGNHPGCTRHDFCIQLGIPETCDNCSNVCGPICTFAGPTQPTTTTVTSTCTGYPYSPPLNEGDTRTSCFTFTAPNDSVSLQQVVSAYCSPNTYSFTYELFNSSCGSIQTGNVFTNNNITGLTPGVNYTICYSLEAACTWEGQYFPYLYTTATVLPVELLFFEAFVKDKSVDLFWATATELNALEYVVEKTSNGKDFSEVGRVKAAGNSSVTLNYKLRDPEPDPGLSFYRLKQIDYNGEYTYSKLVATKFIDRDIKYSIFPNPAQGQASLKFVSDTDSQHEIKIFDLKGDIILEKVCMAEKGLNFKTLDISELKQGYYTVQVLSGSHINYLKLIVQN